MQEKPRPLKKHQDSEHKNLCSSVCPGPCGLYPHRRTPHRTDRHIYKQYPIFRFDRYHRNGAGRTSLFFHHGRQHRGSGHEIHRCTLPPRPRRALRFRLLRLHELRVRQGSIKLSRSSRTQSTQGRVIERIADLQKGDLVFFGGSRSPRTVGHVGIVTEVDPDSNNFKFIHASNSGVKISASNSAYYGRRYLGARRILNTETE